MIFLPLLKAEMVLLKNKLKAKIIDSIIWSFSTTLVSAYVLPAFGMSSAFGVFQASGLLVAIISFELFGNIFEMVSDMEYTGYIKYLLSLPQSNFKIIATKATVFAIQGLVSAAIVFPVISLILLGKMNFAEISYLRLIFALILTSVFFGWFTIFLAQRVKDTANVRSTQVRILFPLWYFGGFSFSFKVAFFKVSKVLGCLCLMSPYMYATEATRSAILGAADFIPFWLSCLVLIALTFVAAAFGYAGLKKRLDFV